MDFTEKSMHLCRRAVFCTAELLNVVVSLIVFTVLDIADYILSAVFGALDSILDPGGPPCYCKKRHDGVLPTVCGIASNSYQRKVLENCGECGFSTNTLETNGSGPAAFVSRKADLPLANNAESVHSHHGHDCEGPLRYGSSSFLPAAVSDNGDNVVPSLKDDDYFSRDVISRWSDCGCATCVAWQAGEKESLYVHVEGEGHENVIFLHGFLSSSLLWSEKVIPYLSNTTRARFKLFAVDLLGFGKSSKPSNCHYTMADHIRKIEDCVLYRHKVGSFHLVAHSMGCLVALALAAAHMKSIKTITLVAPPYFPAPDNEAGASYVLRQVAPRRVWPPIAFGASIMSWYEHVGRVVCFVLCKQHRIWERVLPLLTLGRVSSAAVRDFMQHTHQSAWHIFHNVICGEAHGMDVHLKELERAGCIIHVLHGDKDILVPAHCSKQLCERYSAKLQIMNNTNHFTIIYGNEKPFAYTLENIWRTEPADCKE